MNMKKVLSMLLSVAMILNSLPLTVFATETECTHHTTHTEECGYVEAQEEIPCSHEHGECSYVEAKEEILCTCSETDATDALVHIEGCGYQVAVEAVECDHIHDENCGYKAAVEGVLCSFVCEECKIEQKLKQEPTELLTITVWSWVDEYEILSEDGTYATLPNAADWETLKSVLPASITAMVDGAEVEIPVQWECETFPTEGEGQGTYELKAILPEGYALGESVSALKLEVDLGVADQFADGTTWDGTTVATAYAGGTGTETDPYIIATAGQLIYLRDKVNSGTSYNGKYFRLDADLDMAGKTFGDAIGNTKNYNPRNFNGHFDGNHHKISNLTIGNANGYSALFGNVGWNNQEVVIKNLTLVNVNANRTSTNYGAAALVGNAGYLKLENCTVESGTVQTNSYTAGGFVANAGAYNAISLTIIDCVNKANITQTSSTGNGAGGIVGQGCNQSGNGNTTITGCINYGDVSGRSYAAGIIGNAYVATIEKCANYGAISAIGTSSGTYQKTAKAAGILVSGADKVTSIKNCYNVGNISSNGTTAYGSATQNAGGAAGIAAFNSSSSVQKTITDCHNVGTVTSDYGYPIGLRSKSITNAFYLNKPSQNNSAATQMTAEKFADGTVYNLLSANNPDVWGQTIGTDSYPVFYNGKNTPVIKEKVTITATADNGEYNGNTHAGYKDVSAGTYNTTDLVATYIGRDGTTHADSATAPTNAGKYTVTIAIPGTDKTYTGSVSVDFEITVKEIGITWSNTELTYNGQEQAPTATATKLIDGDTCTITVTGGKTNAGTNYSAEATAVSNPNYKLPKDGVATTFAIKTAEITEVKLTADSAVFTGSAQTPEITSVKAGELTLADRDYTVSYKDSAGQPVTEMKNVGTYTVVVTANNGSNFSGSKEVEWKITKKTIDSVNIDVTAPVGGAAPDTDAGTGEGYSASKVTWIPNDSEFAYNTSYTASVTLTANANYQFASELYVEGWNKTVNADGTVTLTKEFTTAKAKITSVTSPSDVTLTEHKVDAATVIAGLPKSVVIAAEDGTTSLPISWVLKANTTYNPAPNAVNEFTWTAEAGELDANSQTLTGTIKVTNPAPTAVSITAKENPKTVVYDGSAIDLSTLFEFDETVGLATYTVTPIDESAGSLNGSVLTITKAGKFTITVNTAANGIYGAGVATMTLNVNKANGSATITMENWTTGETAKAPVVTSETNDVSAATYLYESTDGKGYSNVAVPTAVGKYKVTAVLPSNDLYNEVAVSVDFEIKARTIIDSIFDWFDREDEEDDRVNITISGDEKSIKAKATVSGKTATVLAPSAAQLNKIIAKTVDTGTVEIDLSSLDKDISKVNLPIKTLKAIVKAAEELGNDTEAMKVLLPNGLAAEFDDKALRAIIDQVKCDQVSLVVEKTGTKRLNSKQKAALSELDVYGGYEAYLYCPKANKRISDFKGGIATLSVPFTVPAGKSAENFSVWYVSDSGKLEQLSTWYSGKKVNWDVSHFSDFIIAYNANTVVKENPNTGAF